MCVCVCVKVGVGGVVTAHETCPSVVCTRSSGIVKPVMVIPVCTFTLLN